MKSRSKQGQINLAGLYTAVMILVTLGIAIGIGIFVINETADATSTTAYAVINETHTATSVDNAGGAALVGSTICGSQAFVITKVNNASNSTQAAYTSGNYTVNVETGFISNLTGTGMGTGWNITYTYTGSSSNSTTSSCRAMTTVGTGVGSFADWIAVIVVVLAAAIVLGVVINAFSKKIST